MIGVRCSVFGIGYWVLGEGRRVKSEIGRRKSEIARLPARQGRRPRAGEAGKAEEDQHRINDQAALKGRNLKGLGNAQPKDAQDFQSPEGAKS